MNKICRETGSGTDRRGRLCNTGGSVRALAGTYRLRRLSLAVAILLILPVAQAWAADAVCVDPASPTIVVVGTTSGAGNEVACGDGATASGANAVAIGNAAMASNPNDVFIGNGAGIGFVPKGTNTGFNPANYMVLNGQIRRLDGSIPPASEIANFYIQGKTVKALQDFTNPLSQPTATQNNIGLGLNAGRNSTGYGNFAAGNGASQNFYGNDAISIGTNANSYAQMTRGFQSVAIGANTITSADNAIALGYNAQVAASGLSTLADGSIAIGSSSRVTGPSSIAMGESAQSNGMRSVAVGFGSGVYVANALQSGNVAIGSWASTGISRTGVVVGGSSNVAIGNAANATGNASVAIGNGATAVQLGMALGNGATAIGDTSFAFAGGSYASGYNGMSLGPYSRALGGMSVSLGEGAVSVGESSLAVGSGTYVSGLNSGAFGATAPANVFHNRDYTDGTAGSSNLSMVLGNNAYAIGNNNLIGATSTGSLAMGNGVRIGADSASVTQLSSIVNGVTRYTFSTSVSGTQPVTNAVGVGNQAQIWSQNGIAIGSNTFVGDRFDVTGSRNAMAIGNQAQALAMSSLSLGDGAISSGLSSIAIGERAEATGDYTMAMGRLAWARGYESIAIGAQSIVNGSSSSAWGNANVVNGNFSHAVGSSNFIAADSVFVLGSSVTVPVGMDFAVLLGESAAASPAVPVASATVGGITYGGFNGISRSPGFIVSIGQEGDERQIKNMSAGQISATSTDAINGSQLYATQVVIDNLAQAAANNFGGGAAVNADGSLTAPGYSVGGATYNNVGGAITAQDAIVTEQGNTTAASFGGNSAYNPATGTVTAQLVVGGTTYNNVNSALNAINSTASAGWNLTAQGANGSNVAPDSSVDLGNTDGNIVIAKSAANNNVTFNLADNIVVDSVTAGNSVVDNTGVTVNGGANGPVSLSNTGLNNGGNTITNVAAGNVSATSTEAVNGSQLYQTNQVVQNLGNSTASALGGTSTYDPTTGTVTAGLVVGGATYNNVNDALQAVNTVATQAKTTVSSGNNIVVTTTTNADGSANYQVATSNDLSVNSVTAGNTVVGVGGVSVDGGPNGSVSLSNTGLDNGGNTITHVAAGVNGTDAVNVNQLNGIAAGGVQYDKNANGSVNTSSITLNPGGTGGTTIHNVAAGMAPTDAVNVSQLTTGMANTLGQANAYTDARLYDINNDIWTMQRGYRGASASAMAMAGLPQAYLPGKSMLAAGVGGYQGEYGMAIGLSGITENGKWVYKAQASGNTSRDWGFSVGAGVQW